MRRLLVLLLIVVVALAIADPLAKAYVESGMEASISEEIHDVGRVDASISSFPFLGRVAVLGEVSHVNLTLHEIASSVVPVDVLRLEIDGLRFDRSTLVHHNRLRITDVDTVKVTATVTRRDVEAVLGSIAAGVLDLADGFRIEISDGRLQLGGGLSIPVPPVELVPCDATATIQRGGIVITCVADRLPAIVVDAIGSVELRGG